MGRTKKRPRSPSSDDEPTEASRQPTTIAAITAALPSPAPTVSSSPVASSFPFSSSARPAPAVTDTRWIGFCPVEAPEPYCNPDNELADPDEYDPDEELYAQRTEAVVDDFLADFLNSPLLRSHWPGCPSLKVCTMSQQPEDALERVIVVYEEVTEGKPLVLLGMRAEDHDYGHAPYNAYIHYVEASGLEGTTSTPRRSHPSLTEAVIVGYCQLWYHSSWNRGDRLIHLSMEPPDEQHPWFLFRDCELNRPADKRYMSRQTLKDKVYAPIADKISRRTTAHTPYASNRDDIDVEWPRLGPLSRNAQPKESTLNEPTTADKLRKMREAIVSLGGSGKLKSAVAQYDAEYSERVAVVEPNSRLFPEMIRVTANDPNGPWYEESELLEKQITGGKSFDKRDMDMCYMSSKWLIDVMKGNIKGEV